MDLDDDDDGDGGEDVLFDLLHRDEKDFFEYRGFVIDDQTRSILFRFSSCGVFGFESRLRLGSGDSFDLLLQTLQEAHSEAARLLRRALWDLGIVVATWTWMGFGCPTMRLFPSANDVSIERPDQFLSFWHHVLRNSLMEFFYCNKFSSHIHDPTFPHLEIWNNDECLIKGLPFSADDPLADLLATARQELKEPPLELLDDPRNFLRSWDKSDRRDRKILVPLGGGKDSIVVWEMLIASLHSLDNDHPSSSSATLSHLRWFHVSDSEDEYRDDNHLGAIVSLSTSDECDRSFLHNDPDRTLDPQIQRSSNKFVHLHTSPVCFQFSFYPDESLFSRHSRFVPLNPPVSTLLLLLLLPFFLWCL